MTTWEDLRQMAVVPKRNRFNSKLYESNQNSSTQCEGKKAFASRHYAQTAATSMANRNGDRRLSYYQCHLCHQFHLTSRGRTS